MKNIFRVLAIAVLFSACQQQQKIGFVNNGDVLDGYQMKIDIEETYKARNEAFSKRMDSIDREFQVEVKAFQLASSKMSQKKAQEKYNELGQKNQLLTQQFQKDQQILQQGFAQEMDSVVKKMNAFVKDYGKANGYNFIFGQNEAGSVLYGEEAYDLTKVITDAMNAELEKDEKEEEKK
ncbi:OmpH family outer membrane protein [Winogradskyella jejuensis]|uniref:Periplasmic chaperone for outer membrane proteins Skp n=1 Tax=Winogradskyella jejuensis TaxID=1089305 RepID=A0A1M5MW02_9FLAO|nr:OmpH family outer membrane protein [Winogradskyella jejuensis]SHG81395.1 periplasmic chaperone for outer membrane proteins Skp [Winogradskyella jejuensis]